MATQDEVNGIFPAMVANFQADKAGNTTATIQFELTGDNGGMYWVKVDGGAAEHGEGETEADMTVKTTADDFYSIVNKTLNPMNAFMMGKIKVTDTNLALKMMQWFGLS